MHRNRSRCRASYRQVILASLIAGFLVLGAPLADADAKERRVALVIGNSTYKHTVELPNTLNDAPAVAASLRRLGFEVVEGIDLTHAQMNARMKEYSRLIAGADVGLFYYAGHGMQLAGENYLIPIDAALKQIGDLDYETIKVDSVLKQMFRETKIKIVLLDSCRDNPLATELSRSLGPRSRSAGTPASGLAQIDTAGAAGTVIAFATSPGGVALDGKGAHSPFTQALLEHLETPDLDIDLVMKRVRGQVSRTTAERQQPWTNSSLNGEFYLQRGGSPKPEGAQVASLGPSSSDSSGRISGERSVSDPDPSLARERELWEAAERSGRPEDYNAYLAAFPDGRYATTARKLAELKVGAAKPIGTADKVPTDGELRSMKADGPSERGLKLSTEAIRDIHTRLALLNHSPGSIRTSFNATARKAIGAWQASAGLVPTGYLNSGQLDLLRARSQPLHDAWVAQGRPELASVSSAESEPAANGEKPQSQTRSTQRQQSSEGGSGSSTNRSSGNSGNSGSSGSAAAEAIGIGIARGLVGRKFGF